MALPTAAYNPPEGISNTTSFPDLPGSSAAFRLQFQTLYDQARDFVNALKNALETTASGSSGTEGINGRSVGAVPAGSLYSQLAAILAIANNAVAGSLIPGCINNPNLFAAGVVALAAMAANSVDSDQYVDGSIDLEHLADGILALSAAGRAKMADGYINAAKLASDAVETAKIKDANVTEAKLAGGAVTLGKLGADVPVIINGGTAENPTQDPEDYPAGTLYGWYTD